MKAQMTKLAAVAAMAVGLAVGGAMAAEATTVSLPAWEQPDGAGGGSSARRAVAGATATPRADNGGNGAYPIGPQHLEK